MNLKQQFKEGLITQNPVTVQLLGMCSVMVITTSLFNGIGMGLSVLVILTLSNIFIAALRKIIPNKIRIACFIVVNCIILGRAEGFCYKNGVAASAADGVFQGLGYTVILIVMCVVRELLGKGAFGGGILNGGDGIQLFPTHFAALGMALPVGGFLTLACVIAAMQYFLSKPKKKSEEKEEVAK